MTLYAHTWNSNDVDTSPSVDITFSTANYRRWSPFCQRSSSSSPLSLLQNRISPCLAQLTPMRVGVARSVHVNCGIPTGHNKRHSVSLPHSHRHLYERASTFSPWPDTVLSLLSAASSSSKWTRAHLETQ